MKNKISPLIENKINKEFYEIFHTENAIKSTDSPLKVQKEVKTQACGLPFKVLKKSRLI